MMVAVSLCAAEDATSRESLGWIAGGGATPLIVIPGCSGLPASARGLLLTGGGDVDPAQYGESNCCARRIDRARDELELALVRDALRRGLPVLGLCRGAQVLAVALGGSLHQDIPRCVPSPPVAVSHRGADRSDTEHEVLLAEGSRLARILGATRLRVNSHHHQAVRHVPAPAAVVARAEDGIAEALELPGRFALGVQWHPERWAHGSSDALRGAFLAEVARGARAKP